MRPGVSGRMRCARTSVLYRAFWAGMLLGHLPAWIAGCDFWMASGGQFHLLRWCFLTLSQVYFVLKFFDVQWLRLPGERRALLALVIIVALLHAGVAQRVWTGAPEADFAMLPVALAGSAVVLRVYLADGRRAAQALRPRRVRQRGRAALSRLLDRLNQALLPPRYLLLARDCCINRAPPQ
jgi:hypothetical protein